MLPATLPVFGHVPAGMSSCASDLPVIGAAAPALI